jgi:peptidyl-prolyl cis-trans isomerase SurA
MKLPSPLRTLLASALLAVPAGAQVLERVVAKVNGDIVTLTEFQARQVAAAQAARVTPDRLEAFLRDNNARILQEAVDELLIIQRGAELGFQLRPEYIDQIIEDIKKENGIESDEQMAEQLRREGLALSDLKRNITRSILRNQVLSREVQQKITIDEDELRAAYEQRKATDFSQAARVHLHEILVTGDDAAARAAELVARARAGEDFAELAREHSRSASRAAGGDLGVLERGDLNAELAQVAFALEAGGVSDPFASGDGYRVLKVSEAVAAQTAPYEEVKPKLQQELQQQRFAAAYDTFIQKLRETALVDVRVREVPLEVAMPATAPELVAPAAPATVTPPATSERSFAVPEVEGVTTTPQARPEKVAPPPRETAPAPGPSPTPTPSPTPER